MDIVLGVTPRKTLQFKQKVELGHMDQSGISLHIHTQQVVTLA